ncbi:MAG: helix-turn-helix domain-containing protein [Burkholderiales bacterium]
MEDKWYSVEQVADMLRLHPKTLRRYIAEGKLRASKLGKQYRISGHDLSIFIEGRGTGGFETEEAKPAIDVSAVVDITPSGKDEADRIESMLLAALNSKDPSYGLSSANIQRSADKNKLRVMLWGTPAFITTMLECISALSSQDD